MSGNGLGVVSSDLRLKLLSFGLQHPYRVVNLEEIAGAIGNLDRDQVKTALERLAQEGLVTRFSGRFCFNRPIPPGIRRTVEEAYF
jgi:DNA-binding GntR family transcriptional regulator